VQSSDPVFSELLPVLVELLNSGPQEQVLKVLAAMIKSSEREISRHFGQIFEILRPLLSADHPPLKCEAIYCMAHLSVRCRRQFSAFATEFASFLLDQMRYDDLSADCINAYGYLLQVHPESTAASIAAVVRLLVEAPTDISVTCLCAAVCADPGLLDQVPIVDLVNANMSSLAVAAAVHLTAFPAIAIPLCQTFLVVATTGHEDRDCEAAFEGLSRLVATQDVREAIPEIVAVAVRALTGDLLCFPQSKCGPVCRAAQNAIREVVNVLEAAAWDVVGPHIDAILELAGGPSQRTAELCGQLLGDVLRSCRKNISGDLAAAMFQVAFGLASSGSYVGFWCLKVAIQECPDVVHGNTERLLGLFRETMAGEADGERAMMMVDNCLSAFGQLVMGYLQETFVCDESIVGLLALMPPRMDAEEDRDVMAFCRWLFDRAGGQYPQEFAAVFVRACAEEREEGEGVAEELGRMLGQCDEQEHFCREVLGDNEEGISRVLARLAGDGVHGGSR
jgi:hypothetical protein